MVFYIDVFGFSDGLFLLEKHMLLCSLFDLSFSKRAKHARCLGRSGIPCWVLLGGVEMQPPPRMERLETILTDRPVA